MGKNVKICCNGKEIAEGVNHLLIPSQINKESEDWDSRTAPVKTWTINGSINDEFDNFIEGILYRILKRIERLRAKKIRNLKHTRNDEKELH